MFTIVEIQCFPQIKLSVSHIVVVQPLTKLTPGRNKIQFPRFAFTSDLSLVVISPPEVGGKQSVISPNLQEILGQFVHRAEVLGVDITVGRSDGGHVGSVEHHRDHVVRQDVEELLRHVVLIKDYSKNSFNEIF